ncbi:MULTISPECIES: tripartite tricarboxylate transporter TctB family protein [unclassified Modestobacter]
MVGSSRYGPIVLVGAMLALGGLYLGATIAADRAFESKIFPLACGIVIVILLAWEGGSMLARRAPAVDAQTARTIDDVPPPVEPGTSPGEAAPQQSTGTGPRKVMTFLGLIVLISLFAYVATQVDYVLGTALFMVACMWLIAPERRSWTAIVLVSAASVVGVNLIFVQVLSIRLPSVIPGL